MKKNLVRIVALLLVAMLALTLLPLGAMAAGYPITVKPYGFDSVKPNAFEAPIWDLPEQSYKPGQTIKPSHFDTIVEVGDEKYEFLGFLKVGTLFDDFDEFLNDHAPGPSASDAEWKDFEKKVDKFLKNTELPLTNKELKIPKANDNAAWDKWLKEFSEYVEAVYGIHQHRLSRWYSDGTTHWRECLVCKDNFLRQNWCQDGDEDGICNVCNGDVPYHDVTVIESEGGTITVNREKASHRTIITADVKPADGYKLKRLYFTKVRTNGSKQEITQYKESGQFWTYMPTYDLEVSADFIKD